MFGKKWCLIEFAKDNILTAQKILIIFNEHDEEMKEKGILMKDWCYRIKKQSLELILCTDKRNKMVILS